MISVILSFAVGMTISLVLQMHDFPGSFFQKQGYLRVRRVVNQSGGGRGMQGNAIVSHATSQTTSYYTGDDGDLQKGVACGRSRALRTTGTGP